MLSLLHSDFSQGEFSGFRQAVKQLFDIPKDETVIWEAFYKFCNVHFARSVERVKSNFAVVPNGRQDEFQSHIDVLVSENRTYPEFDNAVDTILSEFPHARAWLEWHFEHIRGKLIFPIMADGSIGGFGYDTNAQEVTGRWIKSKTNW